MCQTFRKGATSRDEREDRGAGQDLVRPLRDSSHKSMLDLLKRGLCKLAAGRAQVCRQDCKPTHQHDDSRWMDSSRKFGSRTVFTAKPQTL